ncbi:putative aflatoxin regulatory protein [Septoria linicola]|nr:putative aflatoxin regulatory protein [Septoria linicola]
MAKHSMCDALGGKEMYKRPKLRTSCQMCSDQKIRCTKGTKESPACGRCVNKGLDCRYTISRRTGTRRQSVRGTPEPEYSPKVKGPDAAIAGELQSTTLFYDISVPVGLESYNDSPWIFGPSSDPGLDPTLQYFNPFDEAARGVSDSLEKTASENLIPPMSSQDMETLFGVSTSCLSNLETDNGVLVYTSSMPADGHHSHGCVSTVLAILSELHVSSPACSSSASGLADAREFDHVLDSNRDALARLGIVLDCCSDQESVLTASYLAMQKALSWYSAALNVDNGVEPGSPPDRVTSPPAFLGGYALDPEAQALARAYVVMSQLEEHLHPVMAKLSAPVSRASSTTSLSSSMSRASGTSYSAVVDSQKRALQQTLDDIVARVENIKRGSV